MALLNAFLLDGGLRTRLNTFRTGLRPAVRLATLGVVVTAGITALAASLLLQRPPAPRLLVGAIVGSADAAANEPAARVLHVGLSLGARG